MQWRRECDLASGLIFGERPMLLQVDGCVGNLPNPASDCSGDNPSISRITRVTDGLA